MFYRLRYKLAIDFFSLVGDLINKYGTKSGVCMYFIML